MTSKDPRASALALAGPAPGDAEARRIVHDARQEFVAPAGAASSATAQ